MNKIRSGCIKNDILLASYAATELQIWISELMALKEGFLANVYVFNLFKEVQHYYDDLNLPDLTNYISKKDFNGLYKAVDQLEHRLKAIYEQQGLTLKIFQHFLEHKNMSPIFCMNGLRN